jgi:hypothetical protein
VARNAPVVAILASSLDDGAGRLAAALRSQGRVGVALITDVALSLAIWRNSPVLPGPAPRVVHCRLGYLPSVRFALAPAEEQAYAAAELSALALSWLASLGDGAVNRPAPAGLSGRRRSLLEWLALAARVGLPVADAALSSSAARAPIGAGARRTLSADPLWAGSIPPLEDGPPRRRPALLLDASEPRRALVAGDVVCGGPPALRALARAANCEILEVLLREDGAVVGADPVPALRSADHVAAVAALLERRAQG